MNRNYLQAMRFHVQQVQKIVYETRSCIIKGCDNCDYAYICELTNCLLKFIQHGTAKAPCNGLCLTQERIFKSVKCEYMETCIQRL